MNLISIFKDLDFYMEKLDFTAPHPTNGFNELCWAIFQVYKWRGNLWKMVSEWLMLLAK